MILASSMVQTQFTGRSDDQVFDNQNTNEATYFRARSVWLEESASLTGLTAFLMRTMLSLSMHQDPSGSRRRPEMQVNVRVISTYSIHVEIDMISPRKPQYLLSLSFSYFPVLAFHHQRLNDSKQLRACSSSWKSRSSR